MENNEIVSDEAMDNPFDSGSFLLNGIYFPEDSATAEVRGFIGGEAQAFYVCLLKRDSEVTIEFSFEEESETAVEGFETSASFSVNNQSLETVDFGEESEDGKTWRGVIPESGPYYINVVAHPAAKYTLRVTIA